MRSELTIVDGHQAERARHVIERFLNKIEQCRRGDAP